MIKKRSLFAIALFVLGAVSCPSARAQQSSLADEKSAEAKTGTLSGRVVNESGQPLANAAVFVRVFNSAGPGRSTTADSEGKFQVNGTLQRRAIRKPNLLTIEWATRSNSS